ncbi:BppU family phage baseplate upper protein [Staphylococcus epidermidis]|uniref:BppU family phage baseplate upper protein n=2 Tax=Staphylococcus epidermidis TaxID=1282 RepID=UPI00209399AD|nr:BppU family phage baseplate upper protein [Staphylococcus epidermidis]MCO6212079.1 BppU family phage baseplate upper protein [Staphylococcus epidermidis]MCO6244042.1 BppU family phage baseplate upper protein [Staphylococcus epidermidis]MCO6253170.1 BppU family phage baseplate upper protein [Staphylococcus epidermidis]MCO6349167.1 BppU family phage baseplate upper protein [Staphylococcus epidermidis]
METYKTGTVNTIINENGVDLGSINVNLYTMDNKTSVIDIHIKKKNIINENQEYISVNFNQTKFEPVLHVFAQDGSIFTNEPLEIVKAEEGFVRYIIPEYITKHVGQMQCKLFLENPENNDSTHVANFYFTVNDSGITKSVGKEIRVELLDDIVEKVMKDNVDIFKGPKGDTGEQGPAGQDGKDGKNGINGIDGINGNPGPQGPPGRDGKDGVDGQDGSDGKSFDFESLTEEQKAEITPKLPDFSNWQQYKLTNDDGTLNSITAEVDMNMMTSDIFTRTGFNYCSNIKNAPNGGTNKGYINVYIQSDTIGYAFYKDYNSSSIYTNYKYGKNWQGWILINPRGQMTKITNDNGFSFYIDSIDFNDLSGFASNHTTGFFCSNNLKNTPNGYTSGSILLVRTFEEVNKVIYTNPFNNDIYINTSLNNKWSRWRKVVSEDYDTGWIPLPLTNGASPDTYSSSYLPVSYRVITQGESKTIQIIGNIKNLSTGLIFSQLPNNIAPVKTIEYKLIQRTSSNSTLAYISNDGAMKVVGTTDSNSTYMINLTYII